MSTKGKTRWFPRDVHPVRNGLYECIARIAGGAVVNWGLLPWDGNGFLVPIPMNVLHWRGLTKKASRP
jgi:hypothetical protein